MTQATTQVSAQEKNAASLKAVITAALLRVILRGCNVLVDEVKWSIDAAGIAMRAVDPAHVAMVAITVPKSVFQSYAATAFDVAFDVEAVLGFLKLAGDKDVIEVTATGQSLHLAVNGLHRTFPALESSSMTDPKLPKLDLKNSIGIPAGRLVSIGKAAEAVSDHVAFAFGTQPGLVIRAEGDGNNAVELTPTEQAKVGQPGSTLLSLDYLQGIVGLPDAETQILVQTTPDYPARFTWSEGSVSYLYLLAPRIESNDAPAQATPAPAPSEGEDQSEAEAPEAAASP